MVRTVNTSISEDVLDKILLLFWKNGYFNTSIEDLVQSSGFNRATLYKYFGNKHELFIAMLKRYREKFTPIFTSPLMNESHHIKAFEKFFNQFVSLTDKTLPAGCFLIATASDAPSHEYKVKEFLNEFSGYLYELFLNRLAVSKSSKKHGQAICASDVQMANFLVANVFGLMTLMRLTTNQKIIKDQINIVLQTVKQYLKNKKEI